MKVFRRFRIRPARARVKRLVRNRKLLGLLAFRAFTGPLTSFYWYWLPEYLRHGRGMPLAMIGVFAWIPYLSGALGNVAGGHFSDSLIHRGASEDRSRKISFAVGAALSSLSFMLAFTSHIIVALGLICLIVLGNQWTVATYIGTVGDIFPSSVVATVNGLGGVADSGMGMVTMLLTGILVDHFSYFPVLIAAGVLPILALLSVFLIIRRIGPISLMEIA